MAKCGEKSLEGGNPRLIPLTPRPIPVTPITNHPVDEPSLQSGRQRSILVILPAVGRTDG